MTPKQQYFDIGKDLVKQLWEVNEIKGCPIIEDNDISSYGLYSNRKIYVNVKKSRMPVKNPGRSWTYPGYKADLTAVGITAHECGHFIYEMEGVGDKWVNPDLHCDWKEIVNLEPAVSGYEPNLDEAFAEAMKLFITNPDLLQRGRPNRFAFITEELDIKPLGGLQPWEQVLKDAHPKFINAAKNWIKKK